MTQMQAVQTAHTAAEPDCPVCGSRPAALRRYLAPHNDTRYTLHRCSHCELQFWSPLVADTSIYQDDGFSAYADYHAGRRRFPRWAKPLLRLLAVPPGRALDIGCGDGAVMAELQALGTKVQGIDLDAQSVRIAESRCGVGTCSVTTLEDFVAHRQADAPGFDLVTFFEVLEHQVDPKGFLAHVATLTAPGATVAGSVPNRDRFMAAVDRRMDSGDLPPHHFLWLSAPALRLMLAQAGFRDITIQKTGSIGLAETFQKMRALLARRLSSATGASSEVASALALVLAPVPTLTVWVGRGMFPSHLFFNCRA